MLALALMCFFKKKIFIVVNSVFAIAYVKKKQYLCGMKQTT